MKDFLKYTLATIVGFFLSTILMVVILVVTIAAIIASESSYKSVKEGSIMRLNLQGVVKEQDTGVDLLSVLTGGEYKKVALDETLIAIKKAAENEDVVGIYIEGGLLDATPAQLQELRQALVDFKKSDKWIVAYGEMYTKGAYYVCSAADSVYMNPVGALDWSGLASQPIFYKGLLEKLGVKMQVFKVGSYKSAVEPFICEEMSDANREQVGSFLNSIWNNMLNDVATSRHIAPEELNAQADSMIFIAMPERAVESGLVDRLCYKDEVKGVLKSLTHTDENDALTFAEVRDVAHAPTVNEKHSDKIAIYYAVGEIVIEEASALSSDPVITANEMSTDLQKLANDDDVKAVVIRVNSPGGSAFASEQIWREVELLKAKKPVIVSMGGMAASGGYYISCGANKIIAEPMTLTGSIGIFGMIPDASELLTQKLGLTFDVVKTNAMSDFGSMGRAFNPAESEMMQRYIERGYELFTGRVAMGRGLPQDSVKAIAEGRVWTGEQALAIGLVDELGNLNTAIEAAAQAAGIDGYGLKRLPEQEAWYRKLLSNKKSDYMEGQLRATLGEYYNAFGLLRYINQRDPIQARLPFEPNIK